MGKAFLRSLVELRPLITHLPRLRLPIAARDRSFTSTTNIVEPPPSGVFGTPSQPASLPAASITTAAAKPAPVLTLLPLLTAQPNHYITVHIHGRPYLATAGDTIRLPFKMPGVLPGDVLRLNRATVLGSRDFTLNGSPYINEALFECRAVVLGTETEPLRIKIKKKQRNRRKKTVKSKHSYTVLRIQELVISPPPCP